MGVCIGRGGVGGEGVAAEVGDPLEVAAYEEQVGRARRGDRRSGVADTVVDRASPFAIGLEDVGGSQSE